MSGVSVGDELPARTVGVTRADLVRYAGASGDLNPIHWNERVADEVGLPGVIAHGMLTLGLASSYVTDWAGGAGALRSLSARFSHPVVVPDDGVGASVELGGKVTAVDDDGAVTIGLTAKSAGRTVLQKAVAVVVP